MTKPDLEITEVVAALMAIEEVVANNEVEEISEDVEASMELSEVAVEAEIAARSSEGAEIAALRAEVSSLRASLEKVEKVGTKIPRRRRGEAAGAKRSQEKAGQHQHGGGMVAVWMVQAHG